MYGVMQFEVIHDLLLGTYFGSSVFFAFSLHEEKDDQKTRNLAGQRWNFRRDGRKACWKKKAKRQRRQRKKTKANRMKIGWEKVESIKKTIDNMKKQQGRKEGEDEREKRKHNYSKEYLLISQPCPFSKQ